MPWVCTANVPEKELNEIMPAVGGLHDAVMGVGDFAPSLYDRIGGEAAVDAAVKIFHKKVLAEDTLCSNLKDTWCQWQRLLHENTVPLLPRPCATV